MAAKLADIITCAKFQDETFRGYDFTGGRISHFPMDFSMGLTTVQRDCAACDEHLTFSDQISAVSKSCYYHTRELRCLRPYLDFKTASTIATYIVHSKLDYCNSSVVVYQSS